MARLAEGRVDHGEESVGGGAAEVGHRGRQHRAPVGEFTAGRLPGEDGQQLGAGATGLPHRPVQRRQTAR